MFFKNGKKSKGTTTLKPTKKKIEIKFTKGIEIFFKDIKPRLNKISKRNTKK
jgi:hypothetical protein